MFCVVIFIIAICGLRQFGVKGDVTACGSYHEQPEFFGIMDDENYPIYYLNETAERLASEGFNITVDDMWSDAISKFTYWNDTFSGVFRFTGIEGVAAVGGRPASRVRAYYMAQLGQKTDDGIRWLCDGVLINRGWVLSAAHCFTKSFAQPNIVRLGDYDLTVKTHSYQQVIDYPITEIIYHPNFTVGELYNDLVLIPLPRKIPSYSISMYPICLPWGAEANRNLVGSEVVLTGWGATEYGGGKTHLLQQVDLEVFQTSVCNIRYFLLPSFRKKYPRGMKSSDILCAGWKEGGRDACRGDSGGPIAYQKEDQKIVLAGIVSGGHGCGKKGYPGLYIPINKPKYLQWINETAFKE